MKFNINKFITDNLSIHCDSLEQVSELIKNLKEIKNLVDAERTLILGWRIYKEKVYYRFIKEKDKYEIIICNTSSKNKVIEYNEILFEWKMNNEI